jgi:hypothetical protein
VVVGRASESFLYRRGATDRWSSARPSCFQEIVVGYLERIASRRAFWVRAECSPLSVEESRPCTICIELAYP